jgi:IS30 family transposase
MEFTMTQTENNTISRKGTHLISQERYLIERLKNHDKLSNHQIAKELDRSPQTINTEIKNETVQQKRIYNCKEEYFYCYSAETGEAAYRKARQKNTNPSKFLESASFVEYADEKMLNGLLIRLLIMQENISCSLRKRFFVLKRFIIGLIKV